MNNFVGPKDASSKIAQQELPTITRRSFLIGATQAGLTFAFAGSVLGATSPADAITNGQFEPTIWYRINPDGRIIVNVAEAEMGQHIGSALARVVADELEADWAMVELNHVDSDPKWGYMVTGGSWSVWQNFMPLSRAGAAGRMALIDEGAKLLGVAASRCQARDSRVISGNKSISYGDIVSRGNISRQFSPEELAKIAIKAPGERRLIGKEADALDIPGKTNGQGVYGIDARIENMVYARPLIPPTRYGAKINSIDDSDAKSVPGYIRTLVLDDPSGTVPGWGMVIAESFHAANTAAARLKVNWTAGKTAKVSEQDVLDHARTLIEDPSKGALVVDDDGVDAAFATADTILEQSYTTGSVLHFQMEPLNALVFRKDGIWEIHTGNQWQSLIIPVLAKALDVPEEKIVMRTYLLGGGFGRRLNGDYAVPAALASKALGLPVKMVMTREDDARFDSIRSPSYQKMRMAFDADHNVVGMEHHAAAGWPTEVMAPFFMPKDKQGRAYDPFAIQGAAHWYEVGAHRLRAISNDLANDTFRPGWLRSVGSGWVNFALESFMDEAAKKIGADPIEFRLSLLRAEGKNAGGAPNAVGGALRQATVLRRVRELSGWGRPQADGIGLGVATSYGQERDMPTWTACVARVHVDRNTGRVTLERLTLVTDAGTIVSPDGARAQVEGAALWGASMALHEGTVLTNGQVRDVNLNHYTPLRLQDVPPMDIEFVESAETAMGLGEPATTVVGPAIANAIENAVGARLRAIPIRPAAVLEALKTQD